MRGALVSEITKQKRERNPTPFPTNNPFLLGYFTL